MHGPWRLVVNLVAGRLLVGLVALWLVASLLFAATEILPGDFADASAGRFDTPEQISEVRYSVGLYLPAVERYLGWLAQIARGDFGRSWSFEKEISVLLERRLPNTLWLAAYAAAIAVPIGLGLGILAVVWRDSPFDRCVTAGSVAALSLPDFVVAYALLFLLGVTWRLFPVFTVFDPSLTIAEKLHATFLPALSLATISIAPILRLTRANLVSTLATPYVDMARMKGLSTPRIVLHHALPNVIGPITNVIVIVLANLIVSVVVIEVIFAYPGVGSLMIQGVALRDLPLVLACGIVFAVVFILLHLFADVISLVSNPRLKFPLESERGWTLRTPLRFPRPSAKSGAVALMLAAAVAVYLYVGATPVDRGVVATLQETVVPPARERLQQAAMLAGRGLDAGPVSYSQFMPVGEAGAASAPFEGEISLAPVEIRRRSAFASDRGTALTFPGFATEVVVADGRLIPRERDRLLTSPGSFWEIILSAGRAWSEPGDGGWSRASFPFTLVHPRWASSLNGVATFLFRKGEVSDLYVQVAQEAVPGAKADIWGRGRLAYRPYRLPDRRALRRALARERALRLPQRPWRDLERGHDAAVLAEFDGRFNHENISVSALLVDGVLYSRGCRTRYGPYPYCAEMRHAVYSVSKTLGAAVGLLRLAQKYGEAVLDARIVDHLALAPAHDGWARVTFRDALNMATGIGNITPVEVPGYVEADNTALAIRIGSARGTREKLALVSSFDAYPWGPGEVFRYRTSDTFTLAAAMDGYLKSREGPDASLSAMLRDEVFRPLGIANLPIKHSEGDAAAPDIPQLGSGMLPTLDEAARLAILLQNQGRWLDRQILHPELTRQAVDMTRRRGLATGWTYEDGTESRYHMSFWRIEFESRSGCRVYVPAMAGIGGNYILLMPRGLIGLRFADGTDTNPGTWDSSHIRLVADHVRPFCK